MESRYSTLSASVAAVAMVVGLSGSAMAVGPQVSRPGPQTTTPGPQYDMECWFFSSWPGQGTFYYCNPGGSVLPHCTQVASGRTRHDRYGNRWQCGYHTGSWKASGPATRQWSWQQIDGCSPRRTADWLAWVPKSSQDGP